MSEASDEYIETEEAASYLGVSSRTVTTYVKKGKLFPKKDGRRNLFLRSQVEHLKKTSSQVLFDQEVHAIVDRKIYEDLLNKQEHLLIRLAQLEGERKLLLEYKTGVETQAQELQETRQNLKEMETTQKVLKEKMLEKENRAAELEAELQNIKSMSVWKRIFRWKKTETTP